MIAEDLLVSGQPQTDAAPLPARRRRRSRLIAPYVGVETDTMTPVAGAWRLGWKLAFIVISAAAAWGLALGAFYLVVR